MTREKDNRGRAKIHGLSKTRLYKIHTKMKQRCYNKNHHAYLYYGGRGITVCKNWLDIRTFYKWALENGYRDKFSIERVNNNKGYSPNNCKWIRKANQAKNTRWNRKITHKGETKNLAEWARIYEIGASTITARLRYGWSIHQALTTKVSKNKITHKRMILSLCGWEKQTGIPRLVIHGRLKRGWPIKKALTLKPKLGRKTINIGKQFNNRRLTYDGETLHLAEWARRTGIKSPTIICRLKRGWSVEKALTLKPVVGRNQS